MTDTLFSMTYSSIAAYRKLQLATRANVGTMHPAHAKYFHQFVAFRN